MKHQSARSLWGLLRYEVDLSQFLRALFSPLLLLAPFVWLPESPWGVAACWTLVWVCIVKLNYVLHNHIHVPFTHSKKINRWLDWSLGFCTGMTAGNWRVTHVHAHHVEHRRKALKSRKEFFDFQEPKERTYSMGRAVLHCVTTAGPQFWLPLKAGWTKGIRSKSFSSPFYRYIFWEMVGIYALVFGLFVYKPIVASLFILLPYTIVYFISRHVDYMTHTDTDEDSRYGYSVVCLNPAYNKSLWNFGYHIAHHEHPRTHWSQLPEVFKQMKLEPVPGARTKRLISLSTLPGLLFMEWGLFQRSGLGEVAD